ncbi:MAG TPA: hypothetical protein VE057_22540 [Archangium sp.]|nr:hypothetical protein [Archangium sp.]
MESPEPSPLLARQEREMRVERGATRQVRPVEGSVFGWTVSVDRTGNAFVSLAYERSGVDLGGGALPGDAGLALAKYAPDGTHLWSRSAALPGVGLLPARALAVDAHRGQLVVAVNFKDKGQPLGAALVGRVRAEDGQVLSLSPVVRRGRLSVTSLALEPSGHIAVAGFFEGEVDLGGSPFSTTRPRSPFVARFTPDMRHVWSRGLGGREEQHLLLPAFAVGSPLPGTCPQT